VWVGCDHTSTNCVLFGITVSVTDKGLVAWQEVVRVYLQYIAMLRAVGPQEWLFEELKVRTPGCGGGCGRRGGVGRGGAGAAGPSKQPPCACSALLNAHGANHAAPSPPPLRCRQQSLFVSA
jgi:hypothetical protein